MGRSFKPILVSPDLKEISFILILKVHLAGIGIEVSEKNVGDTRHLCFDEKIKEDIFVVLCQMYNINQ